MKAIELFSRSSCPWCRSMCINESEVFFARSKVVKLWKTLYFSCDNCGSFFSKEIPTEKSMAEIYEFNYPEQLAGLDRFLNHFARCEFDVNVLEIGGGINGVSELCMAKYINLDFGAPKHTSELSTNNVCQLTKSDVECLLRKDIGAIVACDVIEHLALPSKIFSLASSILPAGGKLYVQTPEYYMEDKCTSMKERSEQISVQILHINIMTDKTVAFLSEEFGFRVVGVQSHPATNSGNGIIFERLP